MGENLLLDSGIFLAVAINISMLLFIFSMRSFDYKLRQRFIMIFVVLLIGLASVTADNYLSRLPDAVNFRYFTMIVKILCGGYVEYGILCALINSAEKKITFLCAMPYIICSIILLTTPFTHFIFYIDANNELHRHNLGIFVILEGAIYATLIMIICAKKWRDGYTRDAFIIMVITIMVACGIVFEEIELMINSGLCVGSVGVLFIYMYTYAERYNVDSVSKCFKRRCFYSDATKFAKSKLAIISMDLNDLKFINDNYGHKAGDIALLTFAEAIRRVKTNKFILYRTGGDEFMILGIKTSKEEAEELVRMIKETLEETPYSSSYGIYMYNPGDDFDAAVVKADQAMYADKRDYKASHTKRSHSRDEEYEKYRAFTKNIITE